MKNNLKGKIGQVLTNFCPKESWFKVRTNEKDSKCSNCKTLYTETIGDFIGLAMFTDRNNANLCSVCCQGFKDLGGIDSDKIRTDAIIRCAELFEEIKKFGYYSQKELENKGNEELEKILESEIQRNNEELILARNIESEFVETETEQYLIDDYNVIECEDLKHESELKEYFEDIGNKFFKCGQGYYEESVDVFVKIGNKFFNVTVTAEIVSEKQDRGDRLYWVDYIESVTYRQVEKPEPKPKTFKIHIEDMDKDQYKSLVKFLNKSKIKFRG